MCVLFFFSVIKMWDLRKSYTAHHHDPVALQTYPYPGSSTRKLGLFGHSFRSRRPRGYQTPLKP